MFRNRIEICLRFRCMVSSLARSCTHSTWYGLDLHASQPHEGWWIEYIFRRRHNSEKRKRKKRKLPPHRYLKSRESSGVFTSIISSVSKNPTMGSDDEERHTQRERVGPKQNELEDECKKRGFHAPVYQITSDRRGESRQRKPLTRRETWAVAFQRAT